MWVRHNANPISAHVGDCTVRAISTATGKTWERTFVEMCVIGFAMKDMPEANRVWGEYLRQCGYKRQTLIDECTVDEFCKEHQKGVYVIAVDGHVICAIDGNYLDTWDSGNETVVCFWEVK